MFTDIEIAQATELAHIDKIAKKANIPNKYIEHYGKYKAKIDFNYYEEIKNNKDGKLILVTAINPTPAGEGKTTTTIGLADAFSKLNKNIIVALREPSLGPVFGVKGGATGGGYAQVVPMEDINLHFTGDFHAIGAANNLLAAMVDNAIYNGKDISTVVWRRAVDMNDRQLRNIVSGLGKKSDGITRQDGFDITVASEIMAIFCLAKDLEDLKERLGNILVGYSKNGTPVYCKDINAQGAMTALLKDAFKPNLVQTLEKTPVLIHGGPFANIAHGCNSIVATKMAMKMGDYIVTEAGFGADLGAEKFLDIKCRTAGLNPSAVVLVATIRALKYNGGVAKQDLNKENLEALKKGLPNLLKHLENITNVYNMPCVVTLNKFPTDTQNEINLVKSECFKYGVDVVLSEVWEKGGIGGMELAKKVIELADNSDNKLHFSYELEDSIENKIRNVAQKVYGANDVVFSSEAMKKIKKFNELGYNQLPICIAKTQYSLSDDAKKLGRPANFDITVRDLTISAGAGFIVVLTGDILKMPGLPKIPAAEGIDVDITGKITGLF